MPIYEYQCEACGHQLEALQKISDAPLKDCPSCHRAALNKLVSAAGFQLKGSGWYVTDYSDKKKPKGAGKDGNDAATGSGSTESSGSTPNDTAAV
ncbi:FmdB family zinc ribbon protein [Aquicella lusitana]|uniref:Putative FmdB family regulatory protein n=1 Tax=Aquicella lusitana TaxID=254246 RepID=A0A370GDD2_9COXI|nr:zinc ribbon domain-containing protein [Aquicella lusitana]RDI41832.1 putative FmdB family regulatory protein [Aquicella lusitana]VVC73740.1 hypothetical protein AQULUS_14890 [Aquicella lusitana]